MKIFNTGETEEELRMKYNPEGSNLYKAQMRMLDMLRYIKRVCDDNNIEWMLAFGNVLGAVRHEGYIPWDDDTDIILDKKNYEKLCDILEKSNHDQFVLQNYKTDPGQYEYYSVLRDLKSEYIQNSPYHLNKKYRGLQLDIFFVEPGVFNFLYKVMAKFVRFNTKHFAGRGILNIIAKFNFYFGKYVLIPSCRFISQLFGNKNYYSILYGFHGGEFGVKIKKDILFPPTYVKFENEEFPVPSQSERYLSLIYGDYMKLPPISKRVGHRADYVIYD